MKILQIIDVTDHILNEEYKVQNQFTSLINACVSHELRNPLNSIIAKNIEKTAMYNELQKQLKKFDSEIRNSDTYKGCMLILKSLDEGREVQQNSAQFMNFIIQDLLDFAQIKADKFR